MTQNPTGRIDRRELLQFTAASAAASVLPGKAAAQPSEWQPHVAVQPAPAFSEDQNTADILIETLIAS